MTVRNLRASMLLHALAIAYSVSGDEVKMRKTVPTDSKSSPPPGKQLSPLKAEIKAWNEAVEARKKAKKGKKL